MAQDNSFDITSKANLTEVDNSIQMSLKEILNRFDFKGTVTEIRRENETLHIVSDDEYKLKSVVEILQGKFVKRGISLKFLDAGKIEASLGGAVKQDIKIIYLVFLFFLYSLSTIFQKPFTWPF